MTDAFVSGISYHVPGRVVSNGELQAENPDWDVVRSEGKLGIKSRHVAQTGECASDLAFVAANKLIDSLGLDRGSIDCLVLCTQSPDYFLPATSCVLQHRLGLPTSCAAFDFNQGCSGYVYGLYLAKSLVSSGLACNVLLLTAETYTKLIHPRDRTTRLLFGDAASATLVTGSPGGARIGAFSLGTDGAGAENLIVPAGASRTPASYKTKIESTDSNGCIRTSENLYMNGQEVLNFALERVPEVVRDLLRRADVAFDEIGWFVFHQANAFMNEILRSKMRIPRPKYPICLEEFGNTVSNTIPITLCEKGQRFVRGDKVMLVGFGVGYSWGACVLEWGNVHLA